MSDLDKKLEQLLRALVADEWHDDDYLPSYKKAIKQAFIDEGWVDLRKKNNEAGKIQEIQGCDGTWNIDEYNHGLYNGMEYMSALYKGVEPRFKKPPERFVGWGEKASGIE